MPQARAALAPRKLTDMTVQYAGMTLGTSEVVSWKSKDGATIEGVLHKPASFDASRKYPLLVVIHGGPTGVSRPVMSPANRYYPIELFLAKGALVLEPNYRGSVGYGEQFRTLNVRNLGIGDMWDVMSGVDSLIAKGIVDPSKLGSMGWSQGGYISAFLTTNTDRFKAISVGAGISDWTTYYVNTDITPFTRQYLKATPWDDPKIYAETSPMTNSGVSVYDSSWNDSACRVLSYTMGAEDNDEDLHVILNMSDETLGFELPVPASAPGIGSWTPLCRRRTTLPIRDTSRSFPKNGSRSRRAPWSCSYLIRATSFHHTMIREWGRRVTGSPGCHGDPVTR